MQYYSPPEKLYNSEDLDERLDSTIPYCSHQDQYLESKYQNLNVVKQISPPLTGRIKEINTGCFKEDIEETNYFQVTPIKHRHQDDEEDLSIMSVNDLSPLEIIQFQQQQQQQEQHVPVNLQSYHADLVRHYKNILIHLTCHSLPDTYRRFIHNIKENCFIILPCSL